MACLIRRVLDPSQRRSAGRRFCMQRARFDGRLIMMSGVELILWCIFPAEKKIEERLLIAYNRIRGSVKNGIAVASVSRNACSGCFGNIPLQMQSDIRQSKRIIICEHCGRILVGEKLEEEVVAE